MNAQAPTGAEIPETELLERRLDDHRCSVLSSLLLWPFPCLGVLSAHSA
ncbi:hypothetical protein ACFWWM_39175 [Streptomyces sp. NPDC058682]|nr:hypothetical protein [Streptomyces sp. NBC_01214]MCX4803572.1 hypothetical protein [Streptomyces sp. NBC_01214]